MSHFQGTASKRRALKTMPSRAGRVVTVLLTMALALALPFAAAPATSSSAAACDCCASAAADDGCASASMCVPAPVADNGIDEPASKPLGAWRVGIVHLAYSPPTAPPWVMVPASRSLRLAYYLSYHRFLL